MVLSVAVLLLGTIMVWRAGDVGLGLCYNLLSVFRHYMILRIKPERYARKG